MTIPSLRFEARRFRVRLNSQFALSGLEIDDADHFSDGHFRHRGPGLLPSDGGAAEIIVAFDIFSLRPMLKFETVPDSLTVDTESTADMREEFKVPVFPTRSSALLAVDNSRFRRSVPSGTYPVAECGCTKPLFLYVRWAVNLYPYLRAGHKFAPAIKGVQMFSPDISGTLLHKSGRHKFAPTKKKAAKC